ncbi:MAG TPA: hypothetical protein VF463_05950 [Sphingobium sp.]
MTKAGMAAMSSALEMPVHWPDTGSRRPSAIFLSVARSAAQSMPAAMAAPKPPLVVLEITLASGW